MKTQQNFGEAVLIQHFGHLVQQDLQELQNYKLTLIKSICSKKHLLGYDLTGDFFDKLYSFDIDELELLDMEYEEQVIRYLDRRKHV